jgi:nucleoside-diphosphate-sugar epimerase
MTKSVTQAQLDRASAVAFELNAHLPPFYQVELFDEALRVADSVLGRRGLDERKVLIVGGAGYIGSVLTAHLLASGYGVRCQDLLLYHNQGTVLPFIGHPGYEFMAGDLSDGDSVARCLDGITDVVILAGLVGDPITKKYPEASQRINHDGMLALIERLNGRGLNRVVFVSTCSNYGLIPQDTLADENYELSPLSLYAKAKVAMEQALLSIKGQVDYQTTVLRFATAFGLSPRMRFDLTVSEFTRAMYLGEDLLVFDAHTWRPYCHVRDFSEVIRRVLEAPTERVAFEVFNAGGEVNNFTKQMIVDSILERLPTAKVRYQEHGADPRNYRVNFTKIRERLFFEPRHSVGDGVAELVAALESGLFRRVDQPASFFGNYSLDTLDPAQ